MRRVAVVLALAMAFCFVLGSLVHAGPNDPLTQRQTALGLKNAYYGTSIPAWQIFIDGTKKSVQWVDHAPNPRFAIYDPGTPGTTQDDVVLDKETGLVWKREPEVLGGIRDWQTEMLSATWATTAGRLGWRLPRVDELGTLFHYDWGACAGFHLQLPPSHPFILPDCAEGNDFYVWTATTRYRNADDISEAYYYTHIYDVFGSCCGWTFSVISKSEDLSQYSDTRIWPVRAPTSVEGR
jgi:hypothetical protein